VISSKLCSTCKEEKDLSFFALARDKKDGHASRCKVCQAVYAAAYYQRSKDKYAAAYQSQADQKRADARARYHADKEASVQRMRKWREENLLVVQARDRARYQERKDLVLKERRDYLQNNRAAVYASRRKSRLQRAKRVPCWLTQEDFVAIEAVYAEAIRLTKETGIAHHVDHIYPLQGETVSGLHVPSNLCAIPARDNLTKRNRNPDEHSICR